MLKIKNLKIYDGTEIKQNINFNLKGLSLIFGDVEKPQDKGLTSNSLGKTLLLRLIDLIFGASLKSDLAKSLSEFKIIAIMEHDDETVTIKRNLSWDKKDEVYVNEKSMSLDTYKTQFSIDRNLYVRQILFEPRKSLVHSYSPSPAKNDILAFLKLTNLKEVTDSISNIFDTQNKIKSLSTELKTILSELKLTDKELNENIYLIDKNVTEKLEKRKELDKKIENLSLADEIDKNTDKYSELNIEFKNLRTGISFLESENNRLLSLKESMNSKVSSAEVIKYFGEVHILFSELVKKNLEEVDLFHKTVFQDQKKRIERRIISNNNKIKNYTKNIKNISKELDGIGKILSDNDIYKNSVKLSEQLNNEIKELTYRQGQLSRGSDVVNGIEIESENLKKLYDSAAEIMNSFSDKITEYRDFIYGLMKQLYDRSIEVFFDISLRNYHKKTRPIVVIMSMQGDDGEAIDEIKKLSVDMLLFKTNQDIGILIEDSSNFNGIDSRQVNKLLKIFDELASEQDKQAIISINKFQLDSNSEESMFIDKAKVCVLSENDNLLGINF